MTQKRKRKSPTESGAGKKKDLPLGSSELLNYPSFTLRERNVKKGKVNKTAARF